MPWGIFKREELYMKRRRAARTLAFALCAAMLTGSLAACGGKNSGSTGNTGNTAEIGRAHV